MGSDDTSPGYWENIRGEGGPDILLGGLATSRLDGGQDDDRIWGSGGIDVLYGGSGNDLLAAGWDDDYLYGGDGFDELCPEPEGTSPTSTEYVDGGGHDDKLYDGDWATILGGSSMGIGFDVCPPGPGSGWRGTRDGSEARGPAWSRCRDLWRPPNT